MLDFLLEARDLGLYRSITDNGAGGLSSSVGEMALGPGGCVFHLDQAPLKYPGLHPWEILISEAQERMTLAVPPTEWDSLQELAKRRRVEVTRLGSFNDSGVFEARFKGEVVCFLDLKFLHEGLPPLHLKATWRPKPPVRWQTETLEVPPEEVLLRLLAAPNIASKERWVRQYDHEVQAGSVLKPFEGVQNDGPSDAGVIKPVEDSEQGLAISNGLGLFYSDIDTYHMATNAVDEAVRNLVAVGTDPHSIVALDNFCWPDPIASKDTPDGEYKLAQLVRANQGLKDICQAYNVPLISGKDSMKNDYGRGPDKISIPPTLLITAAGTLADCNKAITSYFKESGSYVVLLGETRRELGGSELGRAFNREDTTVPQVQFEVNLALYKKLHQSIQEELVLSCHDLSEGGLGVALAEMCIGGRLGARVNLDSMSQALPTSLNPMERLYSQSPGRILIEVARNNWDKVAARLAGSPRAVIGETNSLDTLTIMCRGEEYLPCQWLGSPTPGKTPFRDDGMVRKVKKVKTLVLTGFGINSEKELAWCFQRAGSQVTPVHLGDLIAQKVFLREFDILGFPGGFSLWGSHCLREGHG